MSENELPDNETQLRYVVVVVFGGSCVESHYFFVFADFLLLVFVIIRLSILFINLTNDLVMIVIEFKVKNGTTWTRSFATGVTVSL